MKFQLASLLVSIFLNNSTSEQFALNNRSTTDNLASIFKERLILFVVINVSANWMLCNAGDLFGPDLRLSHQSHASSYRFELLFQRYYSFRVTSGVRQSKALRPTLQFAIYKSHLWYFSWSCCCAIRELFDDDVELQFIRSMTSWWTRRPIRDECTQLSRNVLFITIHLPGALWQCTRRCYADPLMKNQTVCYRK